VRLHLLHTTLLLLILIEGIEAQNHRYSVSLSGSYTTSSKIYHSYDEIDPARRDQFFSLSDIFGIGIDIRREFHDLRLQVGISAEYLETHENISYVISPSTSISVTDGFSAIPIEITGYFLIPVPLPRWKISVGTGVGFYWGSREYSYASVYPKPLERKIGIGIHVVTGVEFSLSEMFGIRTEVKFREVQFWSSEGFTETSIVLQDQVIVLSQEKIKSRISVDGMMLSAGIVYHL
jgi:hypothetical protein